MTTPVAQSILSIGRRRALQACSTPQGIFTILAADHRDALRVMVKHDAPASVMAQTLTGIKLAIVGALAPLASAVLLDPLYGAAQCIASNVLPGHVGLLSAIEEQGYLGDAFAREQTLLQSWSVEKAKRLGANGVKILLLYHPEARAAEQQEELVRGVLRECERFQLPLFLEPISYSLNPQIAKGSAEFAHERRRIVIASARRLSALRPDVLKVEFPVDVKYETDRAAWADACAELNAATACPWALLSADEPFEIFQAQVRVACENGGSGFLAGRAVWREAATLHDAARHEFLETTARARFQTLVEIAQAYGKPWSARYVTQAPDENWYRRYDKF